MRGSAMAWVKSSYSDGNGDCVEVALGVERVGARDSKNAGAELSFPAAAWEAFVSSLKA